MAAVSEKRKEVVILFAGDSGDGIQLTGGQFTETVEMYGNDIATFPNYPSEIRAPQGTLFGVSGFQLKFGSQEVFTPGDEYDALVVMNAAALKVNLPNLKKGGVIIANTDGFDKKNLRLAQYIDEENPLEDDSLVDYTVHKIDVTRLTRETLKESGLGIKEIDRCKNMFVLGFILWMYNRSSDSTVEFIKSKFKKKPELVEANLAVLKKGFHYGDTSETFTTRFEVEPAPLPKGQYRNINGNQAVALGLIAAGKKAGKDLFYASYPITPASDVLHELSKYKNYDVKTYQAEDEIAAACAALGGSYAGQLGATATSGPGVALKGETLGLAVMLELPLVVINVQRGGPSTGLPTKTEQSDLLQAFGTRSGEAPMVILAASTPSDCFNMTFEAARIAVEHMTPVMMLSDGYIANGAEPWKFPKADELAEIRTPEPSISEDGEYFPYLRDERLVRGWAFPGMKGYQHRVGGLEKEENTGNISYDPENHQKMVKIRAERIEKIKDFIPKQIINYGKDKGDLLILGWGSTYGAIETAVIDLVDEGYAVSHIHLNYINPLPANLGELLRGFKEVLIPEMNNGQLISVIRDKFLIDAKGLNKIKGMPFTMNEIKDKAYEYLKK